MDLKRVEREISKDPVLSRLSVLAKEEDAPVYLVGGYLRDLLLGIPSKDYDLTLPKEFSPLIPAIERILGIHFFKVGKEAEDTATYRSTQKEMSLDLTFLQGQTIDEDLQRRDFTINAMAISLRDGRFHSVQGALEDIEGKLIRLVSKASIDHDPLRMLRAVRYLCTLIGFTMDGKLKEEISFKKGLMNRIPGERVKMELDHILLSPRPALGIQVLHELNLLLTLFPELQRLESLGQGDYHHLNVLSHTLLMVERVPWALDWLASKGKRFSLSQEDRLSLYYSALFHDIGKQDTYSQNERGRIHFYHHESFSSRAAEKILERLRFSNAMSLQILRLIQNHMRILNLSRETKEPAFKRLVNQIGDDTPLLVMLTLADKEASRGILSIPRDDVVEVHCLRILELFNQEDIVHPPSLVTGHDVMALGYPPGPKIGEILDSVRQKQVTGEIKTRDEALKFLREDVGPFHHSPSSDR